MRARTSAAQGRRGESRLGVVNDGEKGQAAPAPTVALRVLELAQHEPANEASETSAVSGASPASRAQPLGADRALPR